MHECIIVPWLGTLLPHRHLLSEGHLISWWMGRAMRNTAALGTRSLVRLLQCHSASTSRTLLDHASC